MSTIPHSMLAFHVISSQRTPGMHEHRMHICPEVNGTPSIPVPQNILTDDTAKLLSSFLAPRAFLVFVLVQTPQARYSCCMSTPIPSSCFCSACALHAAVYILSVPILAAVLRSFERSLKPRILRPNPNPPTALPLKISFSHTPPTQTTPALLFSLSVFPGLH
jgi:hypothetical protein